MSERVMTCRACNSKYRPKVKPNVIGVYEVERIET